jgi:hypothetical protein
MMNQVVVVLIGKGLGGVDTGHKIVIVKVVHVILGGDHKKIVNIIFTIMIITILKFNIIKICDF